MSLPDPRPMSADEIADLVVRARVWRAPAWSPVIPTQRAVIATAILEWRRGRKWSARRTARKLGVLVGSYRKWERGETLPQPQHEAALRELGCQLPEIVRANRRGQRGVCQTQKEAA